MATDHPVELGADLMIPNPVEAIRMISWFTACWLKCLESIAVHVRSMVHGKMNQMFVKIPKLISSSFS